MSVYKEAVQKMPRQFAPHSLFNMMGKLLISAICPFKQNILYREFERKIWRLSLYELVFSLGKCQNKMKRSSIRKQKH